MPSYRVQPQAGKAQPFARAPLDPDWAIFGPLISRIPEQTIPPTLLWICQSLLPGAANLPTPWTCETPLIPPCVICFISPVQLLGLVDSCTHHSHSTFTWLKVRPSAKCLYAHIMSSYRSMEPRCVFIYLFVY